MKELPHTKKYYPRAHRIGFLTQLFRITIQGLCISAIVFYNLVQKEGIPNPKYLTSIGLYTTMLTALVGIFQWAIKEKQDHILTKIYGHMYTTNFSILFQITVFYWVFLEKEYNYHSMVAHGVLGAMIYIPFLYEIDPVLKQHIITVTIVAFTYLGFNLTYVLTGGDPIYSIMTWEDHMSYVYALGAFFLQMVGFQIGFGLYNQQLKCLKKINKSSLLSCETNQHSKSLLK